MSRRLLVVVAAVVALVSGAVVAPASMADVVRPDPPAIVRGPASLTVIWNASQFGTPADTNDFLVTLTAQDQTPTTVSLPYTSSSFRFEHLDPTFTYSASVTIRDISTNPPTPGVSSFEAQNQPSAVAKPALVAASGPAVGTVALSWPADSMSYALSLERLGGPTRDVTGLTKIVDSGLTPSTVYSYVLTAHVFYSYPVSRYETVASDAKWAKATAAAPKPKPVPNPPVPAAALHPYWYPSWVPGDKGQSRSWPTGWPQPRFAKPTAYGVLAGKTILIDPGHDLGNSTHASKINQHFWVGLDKICNTTGTETRHGYAEASYTYDVAQRLTKLLNAAGASVVLTRNRNDNTSYGPCIQARGLLGGLVGADLGVSIHADGGPSGGRGSFVYTPKTLKGYTTSVKAKKSATLAADLLAGLDSKGLHGSTYLRPNISPDSQQGTLNVSTIPIVIVETLNMQNSLDAAIAESTSGRQKVAEGLFLGIMHNLGH